MLKFFNDQDFSETESTNYRLVKTFEAYLPKVIFCPDIGFCVLSVCADDVESDDLRKKNNKVVLEMISIQKSYLNCFDMKIDTAISRKNIL